MGTRLFRFSVRVVSACAALLVATAVAQEASAGIVFDLGNTAIQGATGPGANQLTTPYATLDIVGDTTTGRVTFTLSTSTHNASPPINAVFSEVSFNTNLTLGSDFTLFSASNGNGIGAGGNVSTFGTFDYTVGGAAMSDRSVPFVFVLQLVDPSKALASNFEVANGDGNYFAAHIFTNIQVAGSGDKVTGFIATNNVMMPSAVPEPSTVVSAVSSLVPLGILGLWRRRRRPATVTTAP